MSHISAGTRNAAAGSARRRTHVTHTRMSHAAHIKPSCHTHVTHIHLRLTQSHLPTHNHTYTRTHTGTRNAAASSTFRRSLPSGSRTIRRHEIAVHILWMQYVSHTECTTHCNIHCNTAKEQERATHTASTTATQDTFPIFPSLIPAQLTTVVSRSTNFFLHC